MYSIKYHIPIEVDDRIQQKNPIDPLPQNTTM